MQDDPEPAPSIWTVRRIMLTLIATGVGGFPGGYWYAMTRWTPAAVICVLGTFIGFALSLPGVSIGRVLAGTGGFVASRGTRRRLISEAGNPDGTDPDGYATDDRGRR